MLKLLSPAVIYLALRCVLISLSPPLNIPVCVYKTIFTTTFLGCMYRGKCLTLLELQEAVEGLWEKLYGDVT
jgi:hypothetical protein